MKKLVLMILLALACFGTSPAFAMDYAEGGDVLLTNHDQTISTINKESTIVGNTFSETDTTNNEVFPYGAITRTVLWDGSYSGTYFSKQMITPGKNLQNSGYSTEYMILYVTNKSAGNVYANVIKGESGLGGSIPVPGGSRTLTPGETWMISVSYSDFLRYTSNAMEHGLVTLIISPVSSGARISVEGFAEFYRG